MSVKGKKVVNLFFGWLEELLEYDLNIFNEILEKKYFS